VWSAENGLKERVLPKVLIAEDDVALCENIEQLLQAEQFLVDAVLDGDEAMAYLQSFSYDLMILDWDLPGLSGVEICRRFRMSGGMTPILILTGKSSVDDKTTGLDAGADDYVTKPFHPKELQSRIRALLRRPASIMGERLNLHGLTLDEPNRTVTKDGKVVDLQPLEFVLLAFFMKHCGQVYSSDDLARRVWDSDSDVSTDAIYASIRRLRKKIDTPGEPSLIVNMHGIGYKFMEASKA
jgi:two-component system, OmpR family, manganese sensing response regulator